MHAMQNPVPMLSSCQSEVNLFQIWIALAALGRCTEVTVSYMTCICNALERHVPQPRTAILKQNLQQMQYCVTTAFPHAPICACLLAIYIADMSHALWEEERSHIACHLIGAVTVA